jgi:predicted lysophospholipase L1 biosynthesis ABC-type transport system permease subunit
VFEALGISVIEGNLPALNEIDGSVAVVNRSAAHRLWPDRDALGQLLTPLRGDRVEVVRAVVEDGRFGGLLREPDGQIYSPASIRWPQPSIVVRTTSPLGQAIDNAVRELGSYGPAVELIRAEPLQVLLAESMRPLTFRAWLFGAFAVASMFILGTGALAVSAIAASSRQWEISVRTALGGSRRRIAWTLLRGHAGGLAAGVGVGLLVATLLLGTIQGYVLGARLDSWSLWLMAAAVVIITSLVGYSLPLARATNVEPAALLKQTT